MCAKKKKKKNVNKTRMVLRYPPPKGTIDFILRMFHDSSTQGLILLKQIIRISFSLQRKVSSIDNVGSSRDTVFKIRPGAGFETKPAIAIKNSWGDYRRMTVE